MKNLIVKLVNDFREMDTTPYLNAGFKVDKVRKDKKISYFLTKEVKRRSMDEKSN